MPAIVLVVHDEASTLEMYERLLDTGDNPMWVTGSSAREAIEYALDLRPDVILADLDVDSHGNRAEFLSRLKQHTLLQLTPVLLMVSREVDSELLKLADMTILKPVDPAALVACVQTALRGVQGRTTTLRQAVAAAIARDARRLVAAPTDDPG